MKTAFIVALLVLSPAALADESVGAQHRPTVSVELGAGPGVELGLAYWYPLPPAPDWHVGAFVHGSLFLVGRDDSGSPWAWTSFLTAVGGARLAYGRDHRAVLELGAGGVIGQTVVFNDATYSWGPFVPALGVMGTLGYMYFNPSGFNVRVAVGGRMPFNPSTTSPRNAVDPLGELIFGWAW